MLFDKPSLKTTGRLTFYGTTPQGRVVWGNFYRIVKKSFQIKAGKYWRTVGTIRVKEAKQNVQP